MFPSPPSATVQPFNVAPPQSTDPLATLAQLGEMRTRALQQQQAQLGIQESQLGLQMKQMELRSSQDLMRAYNDAGGNLDKLDDQISQGQYQILPQHLLTMKQTMANLAKDRAQTDLFGSEAKKNAQEALDKLHDDLYEAYTPVWGETDPAKQQSLLGSINQRLKTQGYDSKALLPSDSTPDQIQQAKNAYTTLTNIKAMAEAEKNRMEAEKNRIEARGLEQPQIAREMQALPKDPDSGLPTPAAWIGLVKAHPQAGLPSQPTTQFYTDYITSAVPVEKQPEYQLKQAEVDAMKAYLKGGPEGLDSQVDSIIPPSDAMNGKTKALLRSAMSRGDVDSIKGILKDAYDYQKTIGVESSPQVRAARVGQAVAVAQATAPIRVGEEISKQVALSKLSPGGFANIYDKQERTRAETEFDKMSQDYADKAGAAAQLKDFISAAQSGNKAAPGLIPIATVRELVNRVNRQELQSVSGAAGSAWDRLQGFLGKYTEGQPIPPAVLNDLNTISGTMENAAYRTYQNKVDVLSQSHGLRGEKAIQPVRRIGTEQAPAGAAAPPLPTTLGPSDVGKVYTSPKTGKRMKITAVNPQNPKQFQSQDVP